MKEKLIAALIQLLLSALTPKLLLDFVDMALDFVEDKVLGSASTVDDAIVIPIITLFRETFNIPDNDEPEPE